MPITIADDNEITQTCLNCGAGHRMPLKKGHSKSKKGPYALVDGDTLEVKVDDEVTPQVITFVAADFADIGNALASEVAAKINAVLTGGAADTDDDALRIMSNSVVMGTTSVEATGGTAKAKLGLGSGKAGPLKLGVTKGTGANKQTAVDTIDLPPCPDCGAKESLVRTWDTMPPGFEDSFHAKHRRAVNALAQHLKGQGFSDADAKPTHDNEPGPPPDVEANFPPGPMNLPKPPPFGPPPNTPGGP
ncbi:MAG: hypothetical protein KC766_16890 [Myxococcales bacterium]|nr:hypothetical protein [Myxococcales bacterium]